MIKLGTRFFDETQYRFLTVDGVGANPKVYRCLQEELVPSDRLYDSEADAVFQITDTVLMTEYELNKMEVC